MSLTQTEARRKQRSPSKDGQSPFGAGRGRRDNTPEGCKSWATRAAQHRTAATPAQRRRQRWTPPPADSPGATPTATSPANSPRQRHPTGFQPRMSARRRNTNLIAVTACGAPRRRLGAPEPAVRIATGLKTRLMLGHAPRACRAKAIRLVCKGLGTHVVKG